MTRSATSAAPVAVLALALGLLAGPVLRADITIPRAEAEPGTPSPAAHACELRFRPHTPVVSSCRQTCYMEAWDGPILMAGNTCSHPIWVSYVFAAEDGRTWRTQCYELQPGEQGVAIPEQTLGPWGERRVLIAQEPGTPGYVSPAPVPSCPTARQVEPSTSGH